MRCPFNIKALNLHNKQKTQREGCLLTSERKTGRGNNTLGMKLLNIMLDELLKYMTGASRCTRWMAATCLHFDYTTVSQCWQNEEKVSINNQSGDFKNSQKMDTNLTCYFSLYACFWSFLKIFATSIYPFVRRWSFNCCIC